MIPQFDILRMKKGEYVWLEATMILDDTRRGFKSLEPQNPVDISSSMRKPAAESR
jgi:hypothetical protein